LVVGHETVDVDAVALDRNELGTLLVAAGSGRPPLAGPKREFQTTLSSRFLAPA
jgi:hypothetical protein